MTRPKAPKKLSGVASLPLCCRRLIMPKLQLSWIAALGFALLLAATAWAQPTQPGYVRLARITGQVTVENRATGARQDAADVGQIEQGTIVRTGANSSVILVFSNGSTVNLGADSVLDIEEFLQDPFAEELRPAEMTEEPSVSRTKLNLTRGELVGNVKTLRKEQGSSFTVQTPAGAAGIRGTTFRIVFRPDGTGRAFFTLTTLEGEVGFSTVTGTVDAPQALVANSQEVVVEVDVDDTTGEVTIVTPIADIATQTAATGDIAAINEAVQQVTEAVIEVVLPPRTETTEGNGTGGGAGGGGDGPDDDGDEQNGDGDGANGRPPENDGDNPPAPPEPPPEDTTPVIGPRNPDLTPGDGVSTE